MCIRDRFQTAAIAQKYNCALKRRDFQQEEGLKMCIRDSIGQIPKFDKLIATIRSREISASIILQSQSQLKTVFLLPKERLH